MARKERSDLDPGFEAHRAHFIAKTQEFLEDLRSHESSGCEGYEKQIEHDLLALRSSRTKEESEGIVNAICLKVTLACYTLKAHERASGHQESQGGGR